MKSKRKDSKAPSGKSTFPHLALYTDDSIVLMYRKGSGVVVSAGSLPYDTDKLGGHLSRLDANYSLYTGTICLEN